MVAGVSVARDVSAVGPTSRHRDTDNSADKSTDDTDNSFLLLSVPSVQLSVFQKALEPSATTRPEDLLGEGLPGCFRRRSLVRVLRVRHTNDPVHDPEQHDRAEDEAEKRGLGICAVVWCAHR